CPDGLVSVMAADLDADGDLDVLSASAYDGTVAWYENDGAATPSFTQHILTTTAAGAVSVAAADLDGDGDLDVLAAAFPDNKIAWYRNDMLHRSAAFPEQTPVSTTVDGVFSVAAADVNGDGAVDL